MAHLRSLNRIGSASVPAGFALWMVIAAFGFTLVLPVKHASAGQSMLANVTPTDVDVALVLAVDASSSMDDGERRMQRDGYAKALVSDPVIHAIKFGHKGRIAVTYFEWGSADHQHIIAPWTIIDGPEAARRLAKRIADEPWQDLERTSIGAALAFAGQLFDASGVHAVRRVIDVSGDGPNNDGIVVSEARDALVARGITINGLPIVTKTADDWLSMPDLDDYYDHCVIGGEGAFMIPVRGMNNFAAALQMKLVMEIAGLRDDQLRIMPAAEKRQWTTCRLYE
jgi:hypothetical protein